MDAGLREYRASIAEFALVMGEVGAEAVPLPAEGPRIVLVLDGQVEVECSAAGSVPAGETLRVAVRSGRAVFVPHAAGPLSLHGSGRTVIAYVP